LLLARIVYRESRRVSTIKIEKSHYLNLSKVPNQTFSERNDSGKKPYRINGGWQGR
jgi:hypothetical protein